MMETRRFVRAIAGPKNSVIYFTDEGHRFQFVGGKRTWRNQNPGNMVVGKVSRRNGLIGTAGGFAVFPSYEVGHAALLDLLKNEMGNLSLERMMSRFAPPHENETERYLRFLLKRIGVADRKRKISSLSKEEFERLWQAIEKMEKWEEGQVIALPPLKSITKVLKDKKGTIVAYYIVDAGWVKKARAIAMARKLEVDAVVALSRGGNKYLRTRPDIVVENNLSLLG
jgi:hypothetical protein